MQLRPSQFEALTTKKLIEDGNEKFPLYEYEEAGHEYQYALMEATLFADRGSIQVRLHDGIHFSYINGVLTVKMDRHAYSGMFNALLYSYDVAYVTKKTYDLYLAEIRNPYFPKYERDRNDH